MEKAFARIRHNLLTEVVSKKVRSKIVKPTYMDFII